MYAETLGSSHQDTADAEEYLNELNDLVRNGDSGGILAAATAGFGKSSGGGGGGGGASLWGCLSGPERNRGKAAAAIPPPPPRYDFDGEDDDDPNSLTGIDALRGNQNMRLAFRAVLEEIALGAPQRSAASDGAGYHQRRQEWQDQQRRSGGSGGNGGNGSGSGGARPTFQRAGRNEDHAGGGGGGGRGGRFVGHQYQQQHQHQALLQPVASLSEGLQQRHDNEVRLWAATTGAGTFQRAQTAGFSSPSPAEQQQQFYQQQQQQLQQQQQQQEQQLPRRLSRDPNGASFRQQQSFANQSFNNQGSIRQSFNNGNTRMSFNQGPNNGQSFNDGGARRRSGSFYGEGNSRLDAIQEQQQQQQQLQQQQYQQQLQQQQQQAYRVPRGWDDQMNRNRANPKTGGSFFDPANASRDQPHSAQPPNAASKLANKWKLAAAGTKVTPNLARR